jgi:hypothetical protein
MAIKMRYSLDAFARSENLSFSLFGKRMSGI